MSDIGIGKLITEDAERDAIHIAVMPVMAGQDLRPGQRVVLTPNELAVSTREEGIGIVDPFLKGRVRAGDRFWMFLLPGSITSLRHDWTHPALKPDQSELAKESLTWIQDYAKQLGITYYNLMSGAEGWLEDRDYVVFRHDEHGESFSSEFWTHFERVTGRTVPPSDREHFFTCSC